MAFDVITPQSMGRQELPTVAGAVYTTPADQRDILKSVDIANSNAASTRVSIYLVPSGDSAGADNALLANVEVPGYGLLQWTGAQVLNAGDTIQAVSLVSGVTFIGSGGGCV